MWKLTSLLALATAAAAQGQGPDAAPYPEVTYPGFEDQSIVAGAQSFQPSPPFYPSPWMDGKGEWADAYKRAQDLVSQMTLAEKVNLTTGTGWETGPCIGQTGSVPRLGIKRMCQQDSPLGIRFADYVTAFPAGVNAAATWDRKAFYDRGYAMGSEHRDKGVDMQLGPVVGPIGRAPAGGRGWEGFSPDPYLSGIAVAGTVKGIQGAGVMACTKHLIGNEQEHFRQIGESVGYGFNLTDGGEISSNIDDTTMHELYLWPFADAVRAGTASVMCVYTKINGSYGCQNSKVLNDLLKNELNFQGFVVSDYQAHHSGVSSILAGMDMSMPGDTLFDTMRSYWGANLTIAVLNGTVPEWRVNDAATRILAAYFKVGRDKYDTEPNFNAWTTNTYGYGNTIAMDDYGLVNHHINVRQDHAKVVRDVAVKSTVLLKNTGVLPLKNNEMFTAVFGDDAGHNEAGENGCPNRNCLNGTNAMGWGSGTAEFPYLVEPYEAIKAHVIANGEGDVQGLMHNWDASNIQQLASQASLALVFVNSDSGEFFVSVDGNEGDRNNLTLWKNGDTLIKNVTALCNNTVVVIHSPGSVEIQDVHDNPNVTAILWAGLPGQESGNAIVDILYGRENPGAKLPFTMGAKRQDFGTDILYKPNNGVESPQANFKEGVFIDYRGFDKHNITPTYEFGFGLSYTTFEVNAIRVTPRACSPYEPPSGMTEAAPQFGNVGNASDYLYPSDVRRQLYYIYPFLNSTDLQASSGDRNYGMPSSDYVPEGATDGSPQPLLAAGGAPGGNPGLYDVLFTVYATVKNTGTMTGDEVVQMYVGLGCADDPIRQLRGFERVHLGPGQQTTVAMDLTRRDLSNWDVMSQNWVISSCPKTVYVGNSSRNLPQSVEIDFAQAGNSMGAPANGANSTAPSSNSTLMRRSQMMAEAAM